MNAETIGYVGEALLIGSTIFAIACVALGLRKRELSRRLARFCAVNVAIVAATSITVCVIGLGQAFGALASADAATKATFLASGLSIAMNCGAFFAIAALPPGLAALFLFARAPRATAPAPRA